jgi:hypothetical protein
MPNARLHTCTFEEYNQLPGLRSSDLKMFMESPQKYEDFCLLRSQKQTETDAMRLGTILHALVIEGSRQYRTWPGKKVGKDWKQFKAECDADGTYILQKYGKTDEEVMIESQVGAILRNKMAVKLIEQTAVREQTILWDEKDVACKSRLDFLTGHGPIADLKTAADPRPHKFFRQMDELGYHYSAAFYEMSRDALQQSNYIHPYYWIVVSKKPWFYCEVYPLDPAVRDEAREMINIKLNQFRICQETGNWSDDRFESGKPSLLPTPDWYIREHGIDHIQV